MLLEVPSHREKFSLSDALLQPRFYLGEECVLPCVHGILRLKLTAPLLGTAGFQFLDALVVRDFGFETGGKLCLAPGLLDFAVDLLQLMLKALLEVAGPAFQLFHFVTVQVNREWTRMDANLGCGGNSLSFIRVHSRSNHLSSYRET